MAVVWSFPGLEQDKEIQPKIVLQFQHNPQLVGKAGFSPDGDLLSVPGGGQTSVHDAHTGELLVGLGHSGDTTAAFSPDGRLIATTGNDGLVRLLAANQEDLLALAQSRLTRSLTDEECQHYLHLDACPTDP